MSDDITGLDPVRCREEATKIETQIDIINDVGNKIRGIDLQGQFNLGAGPYRQILQAKEDFSGVMKLLRNKADEIELADGEPSKYVKKLLKDGLNDKELQQIKGMVKRLSAKDLNELIGTLTTAELNALTDEIKETQTLGFGDEGLTQKEQKEFVTDLAKKLNAENFKKVTIAWDDPELFGKVVGASRPSVKAGSPVTSYPALLGYLQAMDELKSADHEHRSRYEKCAANVLAQIPPAQLEAVVLAFDDDSDDHKLRKIFADALQIAIGEDLTTTEASATYSYDTVLLNRILKNGNSMSKEARLRLFEPAVRITHEMIFRHGFMVTNSVMSGGKYFDDIEESLSLTSELVEDCAGQAVDRNPFVTRLWFTSLLNGGMNETVNETLGVSKDGKGAAPKNTMTYEQSGKLYAAYARATEQIDRDEAATKAAFIGVTQGFLQNLPGESAWAVAEATSFAQAIWEYETYDAGGGTESKMEIIYRKLLKSIEETGKKKNLTEAQIKANIKSFNDGWDIVERPVRVHSS